MSEIQPSSCGTNGVTKNSATEMKHFHIIGVPTEHLRHQNLVVVFILCLSYSRGSHDFITFLDHSAVNMEYSMYLYGSDTSSGSREESPKNLFRKTRSFHKTTDGSQTTDSSSFRFCCIDFNLK